MSSKLIVGLDGSPSGERAFAFAKDLASRIGSCELILVFVIEWSPYSFQTPEENAHIEAYHGILKKEVFQRVDYRHFGEIEHLLKRYVIFYNNTRLHGLLGRITPMEKWAQDKHLILMNKLTA